MRPAVAILALLWAACSDEPAPAAPPAPAQGAAAASEEATPSEVDPAPSPAGTLARAVHRAAGGEALDGVGAIRFRFVVTQGGERVFSAHHRWSLRAGRDRVSWTNAAGEVIDALVDLRAQAACGAVAGEIAAGDAQQALSEQAYARWVNDSYWLMMPTKLLDPGVRLELAEPREHEGKRYEILQLSFDAVGLTPGDRYWLYVDPETHRVDRWEMKLEGQEDPPKGVSWTDWTRHGPLTLAMDHVTDDGARHVRFEDVEVLAEPVPSDFEVTGCPQSERGAER